MGLERLRKQENSVGASRDGIPFVRGAAGARFDSKLLPQLERNFRYTVNPMERVPRSEQFPTLFLFSSSFLFLSASFAQHARDEEHRVRLVLECN